MKNPQTIRDLQGVGEIVEQTLKENGVERLQDLLTFYPSRYRIYRASSTNEVALGDWVLLQGQVSNLKNNFRGRFSTQSAVFRDQAGSLSLRWFNSPYIARKVKENQLYQVQGQIKEFNHKLQIVNPQISPIDSTKNIFTVITPIYKTIGKLTSKSISKLIRQIISDSSIAKDSLPKYVLQVARIRPLSATLFDLHFPENQDKLELALSEMAFREVYNLVSHVREEQRGTIGIATRVKSSSDNLLNFQKMLSYPLTAAQLRSMQEIEDDLAQTVPMQRLLAGDVGSGKTTVAAYAAYLAKKSGVRTIVLAPTQILAAQLYDAFSSVLDKHCSISQVTGKRKDSSESDILIGTQAVLNLARDISNIGLVIIDEQHRFGVKDRELLRARSITPHELQMTATPIPRTLAQTELLGKKVSRIDELPKNRLTTKTMYIEPGKRLAAYNWLKSNLLESGEQAYIVAPLIEEDEGYSVKDLAKELSPQLAPLRIKSLYGTQKEEEKIKTLTSFKNKDFQVLIATSIIEVGIDVKDANYIVIEGADKFGLATLHQLRGRVGRAGKQGYCLLLADSLGDRAKKRLSYLIREKSGEKLAKFDLQERGPGELYGLAQSGFLDLHFASLEDDKLFQKAITTLNSLAKYHDNP